jgi:hypothetical protein
MRLLLNAVEAVEGNVMLVVPADSASAADIAGTFSCVPSSVQCQSSWLAHPAVAITNSFSVAVLRDDSWWCQ